MNPAGVWLALAGTSEVAGGGAGASSPPPQAPSSDAARSAATSALFMAPSSLRTRPRRAEIRKRRQQRTVGLDLRSRLVDTVVQPERRRAERRRARLAGRAELVRVGVAVGNAEAAHHRDQRDVDDVIARTPAVRIAGEVLRRRSEQPAEEAEPVLV